MALPDNLADLFTNKASKPNVPAQPESLRKLGYTITKVPTDFDGLPPATKATVMALLRKMAHDNTKPGIANDWKSLIREHPDVPGLKRQLALTYAITDRDALAEATFDELATDHPTYLPGVIRRATYLIAEDRTDEADVLLGGPPVSLRQLAPDRPSFSMYEVGDFAQMALLYEANKGNADAAEDHLRVMRDLGTYDIESLRVCKQTLDNTRMMNNPLFADTISISGTFRAEDRQTDEAPTFIHSEINWLYEHDLSLPAHKRDALLALPRPSLTADLSAVLLDLVLRFDHFAAMAWDATTQSFGYHALLLVTELRATECLDAVLETLRQGEEVTEFWFNDWREDYYTPYFRRALPACADELLAFMQEPDINTYSKSIVSSAYAQEAALQPDRRAETIRWYEQVLDFFLKNADDPDQLDMDLNALIVCDLLNLEAVELLPQVRDLYNRNLASKAMVGGLTDVEKKMATPANPRWQTELKPIADQYAYLHDPAVYEAANPRPRPEPTEADEAFLAELEANMEATRQRNSEWAFLDEEEDDLESDDDHYELQQPRYVAPEPGRNDKVSVRYTDGKVVADVKYKKVEPDVKAGRCVLL